MTNFADLFNSTPVEDRGGDNLTPGRYVAKVTSAQVRESKAGNYGVMFILTCIEGDSAGDSAIVSAYLTDKSKAIFVETLAKLGITGEMMDADDAAAIQTAVGQVWGITVAVQKNNPEYTNTYLNKRRDDDAVEAGGDAPEADADAPTPPAPSGKRPF